MALDRPFDDGRVQTAHVAVKASTVSANMIRNIIRMFTGRRTLYFRHISLDEAAEAGVSDQQGKEEDRRAHTSGGERAEI